MNDNFTDGEKLTRAEKLALRKLIDEMVPPDRRLDDEFRRQGTTIYEALGRLMEIAKTGGIDEVKRRLEKAHRENPERQ